MKKLLTIGLAAAVLFTFAGQAKATALETSGEFRGRYWYLGDYFQSGKNSEFWDSRLRLNLVWPVAEGVKVSVRADVLEGFWGDRLIVATTTPATDETPSITTYTTESNTRPAISFDQVNLEFKWPNTPLTFVVGRQGTTWGPGFAIASDNRDRFKVSAKVGAATLFYTYDKYIESVNYHDTASLDDRSQHSVGVVGSVAGWNSGFVAARITNDTAPHNDQTINLFGLYTMGQGGPVGIKAEVAYAFGEDDHNDQPDVDLETLMAYVGLTVPAGPVSLGFEGAYVSGDDPSTKTENEGVLTSDYQSPFWSVILFNNMEYNGYQGESNFGSDSGMANAAAGKFSLSATPAPGLSLYGAVVYASRLEDTAKHAADPLGTEIDLVLTYAITPNVSWTVGGGYLMAGDFFGDVNDPWGAVSAFTVKF